MKKLLSKLLGTLCLLSAMAPAYGAIVETSEVADVRNQANESTLVLFNITDTLYEPATTLADNHWRLYFADRVNKRITDPAVANAFINKIKNLIVQNIPKKAVDPLTPQLIHDLQEQHIPVLGLTKKYFAAAYADNFGEITSKHLISIGINLENTLNYLSVGPKQDENNHTFAYGIIFTNKQPEGPALLSFVKRLSSKPKKVLMVDNSFDSLKNVEISLENSGMEFIGFRYSKCDGHYLAFDPDLGTIEFFEFIKSGSIMSDEEAKQIKLNDKVDYEALLDAYIDKEAFSS